MAIGDSITSIGASLAQRGSQLVRSTVNNAVNQARGMAQNAARNAINKGLSYVSAPLRGIAGDIAGQMLGSALGGGCSGGSMYGDPEDFNKLRQFNKKLVQTEFVLEWNFRLEIEGQPEDFDLYIKDVSYGGFEGGNDEENYGSATYSWPNVDQPLRISFTARDNYDLRMAMFLHEWQEKTINRDGTVGLPYGKDGYVRNVLIYHIKASGQEIPIYNSECYPLQLGDVTRSHENGQFMEMPVTLVQFSTINMK